MKAKFTTALFYIGIAILIIGSLFKIQHWPYGEALVYVGLGVVLLSGIISAIQYANRKNK